MPTANTPRILALKKKKCRRIVKVSSTASLIFTVLFLISIKLNPPAPFLLSIIFLVMPFLIFFSAVLYYYHVKLFPKFDYGNMTKEEIEALEVSPVYIKECRKIRMQETIMFILLAVFAFAGTYPLVFSDNPAELPYLSVRHVLYAMDFLPYFAIVMITGGLTYVVRKRRHIEFYKYTLK